MWEQLTPADIQRVKHRLALERTAILSRHAAELKTLDTQQDELEKFERIVAAFAEKYLNTETSPSQPTTLSEEQPTEALAIEEEPAPAASIDRDGSEPPTPEAQQDAPSPGLDVVHRVSPNFGIPLRRFEGR